MKRRRSKSKGLHKRSVRRLRMESLEQRRLLAVTPLGVTHLDTGEFLLGSVGVTPVLFESDGSIDPESQDWTVAEIDETLARISEGVNWWSDTLDQLNTVHTIDFVFDNTFALNPVETGYEPIDRISNNFNLYVGDFLTAQGFGNVGSIEEGMKQFNAHQREQMGTDWAFTIFMVDSSDDPDGRFLPGGFFQTAFAYAGGLFVVSPSTRPASTIAHEMGHIFWAKDEYPGGATWTDRRGYYNSQNLNAFDNPTSGFVQEDSIMSSGLVLASAYAANESPDVTLAMIGWRDTDGDGIFDLADVPLDLKGQGYFDSSSSTYQFTGSASAVPLINQNSSGPQSDITLNRISRLQYRVDGGAWVTVSQPDQQQADFDVTVTLGQSFSSIQWRVIDDVTGVTSAVIQGDAILPAYSLTSGSGVAFLDEDNDDQRNGSEQLLVGVTAEIKHIDGSNLVFQEIAASYYPTGFLPFDLPDVTLTSQHPTLNLVSVGDLTPSGVRVFQQFDASINNLTLRDSWTQDQPLSAAFDSPVGEVAVDVFGAAAGSYVRIEAMDAAGNLLQRTTSDLVSPETSETVRVNDPQGRIASVLVYGHAETEVLIRGISFGTNPVVSTGPAGGWRFDNLPVGQYTVDLTPELLIHQFDQSSFTIDVTTTGSGFVQSPASRVDCPYFNAALPEDTNDSGTVTVLDALTVLNDIAREGVRVLQAIEPLTPFVDVNNDGRASTLDALLVLNKVALISSGGEGEAGNFGKSLAAGSAEDGLSPPFLAMTPCFAAIGQGSPGGGVLNYADSHRRSESIGSPNADNAVYGPLQEASPPSKNAFLKQTTAQKPIVLDAETVDRDVFDHQFGLITTLQLPE
ncbi:MAG: protein containing Planctomycete extracellular domain protein [Planctomycetaceae bacterium]|nr:protein containing Planctomycete extracellular domain protein [Planctomycetaceae bacterium]